MNYPLAVFSAWIGVRSETFIRRHMQDLLPGGTVVVAWDADGRQSNQWREHGPVLLLRSLPRPGLGHRLVGALARVVVPGSPPRAAAVERFIREHQVKVILAEYLDYGCAWVDFAQRAGIRFFAHAHGYDVSRLLRSRKWRSAYLRYNRADGVISMSHFAADRLAALGISSSKIHVIPYGVDVADEPVRRPERAEIRCVAVGRMVPKKAPLLTLEAFRQALSACAALRLDYVGGGDLLPAAQQFVRDHALEERVTLHGAQPHEMVKQLLHQADVFLQHSITDPNTGDEEGLPVAILEAMAQSVPVVATRHAGIPEAVQEGVSGYLVDEGDTQGMAECLAALANDPDRRWSMAQAAWQRVKQHFSWDRERVHLLKVLGLHASRSPERCANLS